MNILIDTDVLLDIGLKRESFYLNSARVISLAENHKVAGYIAWHTLSNFYYLTSSDSDRKTAKQFLEDLLKFIKIAPVDTEAAKKAFIIETMDFEDAMQISSAISCNAKFIVTRNVKHYQRSPIQAIIPDEFIKLYK